MKNIELLRDKMAQSASLLSGKLHDDFIGRYNEALEGNPGAKDEEIAEMLQISPKRAQMMRYRRDRRANEGEKKEKAEETLGPELTEEEESELLKLLEKLTLSISPSSHKDGRHERKGDMMRHNRDEGHSRHDRGRHGRER